MNEIPGLLKLASQSPKQNAHIDPVKQWDANLSVIAMGIKNACTTSFDTTKNDNQELLANLEAVMSAPSTLYTDVLGPDGQRTLDQVQNFVQKQFVQQFYEAYMAPVASKDVLNRLGSVTSVVSNVADVFPRGVSSLISSNTKASASKWRTSLNYAFKVVELPAGNPDGSDIVYTFNSLAFPPFRQHEIYDLNSALNEIKPSVEKEASEKFFDMQNLTYRQNQGTCRTPAFKAVNDNIQVLQYMMSRCFGIESTYMTEWDLTMYIQEGLCAFTSKEDNDGNIQQVPKFVTNLTNGLIEDSPIDLKGKNDAQIIEEISTYASVNMAVSTKMSIDNLTTGSHCNELSYEIAAYPLSKYWYPPRDGQNDETPRNYTEYDEETKTYITIGGYLNVPEFIRSFFAYAETGEIYDKRQQKNYTALQYRGQNLANSTKSLLDIIHYNDARNAILTGWLSTDTNGKYHIASGLQNAHGYAINHAIKSNAYSYIPYWKLFYATPGDGMDKYDIFIQDTVASDAPEMSFLNVAYTVIGEFTSDNEPFNNFTQGKSNEVMGPQYNNGLGDTNYDFDGLDSNFNTRGNLSFKIPIVGRITIPHTKLLNMFLHKDEDTKKAMAKADSAKAMANSFAALSSNVTVQQTDENGKPITHTEVDENGVEYEVSDYSVPTEQKFDSNLSYGHGVANYNPMMYGGPHGEYFSPLTLEGYTQLGNELLSRVPTMDPWFVYRNTVVNGYTAGGYTKNYKVQDKNYADALTVLTLNEREAILRGDTSFGIQPRLNNYKNVLYGTGYNYEEITSASGINYHYRSSGYGRYSYWYSWRTYDYGYRDWTYQDGRTYYSPRAYRGYWNSNKYGYTSRYEYEDCTNFITDENVDKMFKLIPVTPGYNDLRWAWNQQSVDSHIRHDDGYYGRDVNAVLNGAGHCVDYIIAPNGSGSTGWANGSYNTTYGTVGTPWGNKLKEAYNNGTTETFVSLPISYKGAGAEKCMGILCGVATIVKSQVWVRRWGINCTWYQHSRRCWWRRHWYWCLHWWWGWQNILVDTYTLVLRTNRLKYFYPFKNTIDLVANAKIDVSNRNKNVADIVMRWSLGDKGIWRHVTDDGIGIFPLLSSFITKYGVYEATNMPGRSYYYNQYYGSILKTNGVFFGDILENFRNNNNDVRLLTGVRWTQKWKDLYTSIFRIKKDEERRYRYGSWSTSISLPKERGRDWWRETYWYYWWGRWYSSHTDKYDTWNDNNWWQSDLYAHTDNQSRYLRHWANSYRNEAVYGGSVKALSDKIHESFGAPAVMEYYKGTDIQRQFFRINDTFDVFIDTATQQIAWLNELSSYADKYLTDENILKLYGNSTDPKIRKIITKAVYWLPDVNSTAGRSSSTYLTVRNGPFTINPTEDVNYVEALEILVKGFKGTGNVNTLKQVVDNRINRLKTIKTAAISLKKTFNSKHEKCKELENFSILVHNTKQLLHGVVNKYNQTAETVCFNGNTYNGNLFDTKNDVQIGESTYNIIKNPAALLWAYLNVLYQNRKYWINLRMNKMAGSYWNLRNLERALTFILASDTASDDNRSTPGTALQNSEDLILQTRDIKFVQARKSFQELALPENSGPVYTNAVWVAVEYIQHPDPTTLKGYNQTKNTYEDREIVYIPETYKYAYKPEDGLYFIVSEEISNKVKGLSESLTSTLSNIASRDYTITELDIIGVNTLGDRKYEGLQGGDEISMIYENIINLKLTAGNIGEYTTADDAFLNDLVQYKKQYYNNLIKQYLIGIYIKWRPEHVWTGTDETGVVGKWAVDSFQEEFTSQGVPRNVMDLYGIEHVNEGAISAGITFGVTEGFDMDLLLTNISNMRDNTVLEALCTFADGKDWWRIEIPEEVNLLKSMLKTDPKLVPAYNILPSVAGLGTDEPRKSTKTALVGVSCDLYPVKEPSADLLTVNTAAALGLQASDALSMFNILGENL